MANLNLICGIPASGKDTYLKKFHSEDYIVSRDVIRFSMLSDDEEYFAHEKEVYVKFIGMINYYGAIGDRDVWVNQTNLNYLSRAKVLSNVQLSFFNKINAYYIPCSCEVAIQRNKLRQGRARVPEDTLRKMYMLFTPPESIEGFDNIYRIEI